VRTRRFALPFECRFQSQDVKVEIFEEQGKKTHYDGMIAFDTLFQEAQLLQEPVSIRIKSDPKHLVRISVMETIDTQ